MSNPIPARVRGWLYVVGVIVGVFVAVVVPDLLVAVQASPEWSQVATRGTGALMALLLALSRANLSDPAAIVTLESSAEPVEADGFDPADPESSDDAESDAL